MPRSLQQTQSSWRRVARQLLVERRRYTEAKWTELLQWLREDITRHHHVMQQPFGEGGHGQLDPREPLLWAWCTLMAMPEAVGQRYAHLREADLGTEAMSALRDRGYALEGLATAPEMQLRWLAVLVRTLDDDLSARFDEPSFGQDAAERWRPDRYPCLIVPIRRAYRLADGKGREQRAMCNHAIIPDAIGDVAVRVFEHPDVERDVVEPHAWNYGAAVLEGLELVLRDEGRGFIVADAPAADWAEAVDGQLEGAKRDRCDALVWPELTMTPERRTHVREKLAESRFSAEHRMPLVVAGSWHEDTGEGWVNRSLVLTGTGKVIATHDKRRIFSLAGKPEAIRPGTAVSVIVMEDRLVGLAICKDACDDCAEELHRHLGLDVLLVPSMGDEKTLRAQERHAAKLRSQQGTITFLVQQVPRVIDSEPPAAGAASAYSFATPPPADGNEGNGSTAPDPVQNARYRSLKARR